MSLSDIKRKYTPFNKAVGIPLSEIDHDLEQVELLVQHIQHARREHINYHSKNRSNGQKTDQTNQEILTQVETNQNGAVSRQ